MRPGGTPRGPGTAGVVAQGSLRKVGERSAELAGAPSCKCARSRAVPLSGATGSEGARSATVCRENPRDSRMHCSSIFFPRPVGSLCTKVRPSWAARGGDCVARCRNECGFSDFSPAAHETAPELRRRLRGSGSTARQNSLRLAVADPCLARNTGRGLRAPAIARASLVP